MTQPTVEPQPKLRWADDPNRRIIRRGSIVEFVLRDNEEPVVGIVLHQHPDGSVQLYALHFEAAAHHWSVACDQVTVLIDPDEHRQLTALLDRRIKPKPVVT